MIKAIIFDCFGVLTTGFWKEFCATLPDDKLERARELNRKRDSGEISNIEFVDGIESLTGRKPPSLDDPAMQRHLVKNTGLMAYIERLKPNYKIGLLSNVGSDWIEKEFLTPKELGLFDTLVASYKTGLIKPDPRIYGLVLEKLDVKPQEAVFIDDIDEYCAGARSLGMQAITYKNFVQMKAELDQILAAGPDN